MVRDELRKVIYAGEISPGASLRQDELAERFGTSRIPVREALRQLKPKDRFQSCPIAERPSLNFRSIRCSSCRISASLWSAGRSRLAIPNMIDADTRRRQIFCTPTIWSRIRGAGAE